MDSRFILSKIHFWNLSHYDNGGCDTDTRSLILYTYANTFHFYEDDTKVCVECRVLLGLNSITHISHQLQRTWVFILPGASTREEKRSKITLQGKVVKWWKWKGETHKFSHAHFTSFHFMTGLLPHIIITSTLYYITTHKYDKDRERISKEDWKGGEKKTNEKCFKKKVILKEGMQWRRSGMKWRAKKSK